MLLRYVAIAKSKEKIEGDFSGTKEDLVKFLQKEQAILLSVEEVKLQKSKAKYNLKDFALDIEELSYLVGSGLEIDKAVSTIIKNSKKEKGFELWSTVLSEIKKGNQFSTSLKIGLNKIGLNVSDFYISILSVSEEIGDISNALKQIHEHLEFKLNIKKDIAGALAYPLFLIGVSILAVFFIAYFILPKFASIFTPKDMQKIPALSKAFIEFGQFVHNNPQEIFIVVIAIVGIIIFVFSAENVRKTLFDFFQKLPVVKDIALEIHLSSTCSSLGAMLKGGVGIEKAVKMTQKIISHSALKKILEDTYYGVKRGIKISEVWSKYSIIPSDIISMVSVGENSADLDEIFLKLGERHLENFRRKVQKMMTFFEPLMIVILGLIIGLIVVSIMLAVLSLTNVS